MCAASHVPLSSFLFPSLFRPFPPSTQVEFSESDADGGSSTEVWGTGPLAHDSSAREVEAALEALTGIGDVAVHVELLDGGYEGRIFSVVWPVVVGNVPKLNVNGSGLTPGSDEAAAVAYVNEVLVCVASCVLCHLLFFIKCQDGVGWLAFENTAINYIL